MTDAHKREQDARFDSCLAWVWWPLLGYDRNEAPVSGGGGAAGAECIDSSTGFAIHYNDANENDKDSSQSYVSLVSSSSLLQLFAEVKGGGDEVESTAMSLKQLRALKRELSSEHEMVKDILLSKHRVFRQWRRREYEINQV